MISKPKLRPCKVCKTPYLKTGMGHVACSISCALEVARISREKLTRLRAKYERAEDARRREDMMTLNDWIAAAQKVFNSYIRARDEELPCICCNKFGGVWSRGGIWDAGHYRSRGSAGHLRFDERNVHKQLKQCNSFGAGRHADFRRGLIVRIGLEDVEALESDQTIRKWTIAECREIITKYRLKLKSLKNT